MTTPQEPTVAIRGTWPLPVDRFSWLVAGLLFVLLIIVYYSYFYPRLEAANNSAHIFSEPRHKVTDDEEDNTGLELKVASPRYISDLTRQTLLLGVTNKVVTDTETISATEPVATSSPISIAVVPRLSLLCVKGNKTDPCGEEADYYVFLDSPDDSQPTLQQGGYLLFTDIPGGASVSQELIVEVVGLTQSLDGESEPDGSPVEKKVEIEFEIFNAADGRLVNTDGQLYSPKDPLRMEIDSTRAVLQGIMSFLLLPPWANGFIPLVAVFIAYLFGVSEALRRFVPVGKSKNPPQAADVVEGNPITPPQQAVDGVGTNGQSTRWKRFKAALEPDGTRWGAGLIWLVFWLLLMLGVAVLALWLLTEVAVVFLADAEPTTAYGLGALLLIAVVIAVIIDWFIIRPSESNKKHDDPLRDTRNLEMLTVNAAAINLQPPNGQPLTMPISATAVTIQSPDGQSLTMSINGAVTIQSPEGQSLSMPVSTGAVTIQPLEGQPLTMPVNAGALTVQLNGELFQHCVPHPCHQPSATAQTGDDAPPPPGTVVPVVVAPVGDAPPAVPPAGAVAPVVVPPVGDAPNPEAQALEEVRQLRAEVATLLALLARPAPGPDVADTAPPKPDIPPQATSRAEQDGGIFTPPSPGAVPPIDAADETTAPEPSPTAPDADPPRKDPF